MTAPMRLDLELVLPDDPSTCSHCVERLVREVQQIRGTDEVHVVGVPDDPQLCVHYDAERVAVSQLRAAIRRVGAALHERYRHDLWNVEGISHIRRADLIAERLRELDGVIEAEVTTGRVRIERDAQRISEAQVLAVLGKAGVVLERGPRDAVHDHDDHDHGPLGGRAEMGFAFVAAALLGLGYALSWLAAPGEVPTLLYLGAYFFGGYFMVRETWVSVRAGTVQIESLMLVAAAGAAVLGEFAEGALLLVLFSLGHSLEEYAMGQARRSIEALAKLTPDTATVRRGVDVETVRVDELVVGDVVLARPNERIPADGTVLEGRSAVDQAPVTGESVPVDKGPDDPVFAGTINGSGAMAIVVSRLSSESTLARVVELVSEAETSRSPTQRLTARFERVFVPMVLGLAFVLLFAWVVVDEPFQASFYRSMAVLVAASPCALAIATPSAVLSGIARAARGGVLVKGGDPLERLGGVTAIAFDKTGTLTEGTPIVTDVVPESGVSEQGLLGVAGAVELLSDHPLAAAVVALAKEQLGDLPEAQELEALTGRGVRALVNGKMASIGNRALFEEDQGVALPDSTREALEHLQRTGRTTMVVRHGEAFLGVLGLMDTPREGVAEVLGALRSAGLERLIMLSGDSQLVASAVADELGLDDARGDLLLEDKVAYVRELADAGSVAMIGDGVNDAPALATATVGVAMGAAGSDVALETADVALMADDLGSLAFAVGLSRATAAIIRQNLFMSLGMVALLVPATVFGLGIGPAVMLHEGSTVIVVVNALRLLVYTEET